MKRQYKEKRKQREGERKEERRSKKKVSKDSYLEKLCILLCNSCFGNVPDNCFSVVGAFELEYAV